MRLQPRHDAADQRDEQQQIGRGEPGRGEHVEEPGRVEDLRPARMVGDVLVDLRRVQRCAAAAASPVPRPAPAGSSSTSAVRMLVSRRQSSAERQRPAVPGPDRRRLGRQPVRLGVDRVGADRGLAISRHSEVPSPVCPTREVSSIVISPQRPVTSSRPSTTSSPPPTTSRRWRAGGPVRPTSQRSRGRRDERHPEPEAVRDGEGRRPAGGPPPSTGRATGPPEGRADARCPAQPANTVPRTGALASPGRRASDAAAAPASHPAARPRKASPSTMMTHDRR